MKKTLIGIFILLCGINLNAAPYPDLQGKIIKEIKYTDKTGENVIVLTQTNKHIREEKDRYGNIDSYQSKDIYAYRYLMNQGQAQKIWQIHDFIHDCDLDISVDFYSNLVQITDLNKNQIKEVWIPYTVTCAGDISVYSKIIMYEDSQKYASRGEPRLCYGKEHIDANYSMDNALKQNQSFRKFADSLWQKISVEQDCKQ